MKRASDAIKIFFLILLCLLIAQPALAKKSHHKKHTQKPIPQVQVQPTQLNFGIDSTSDLTPLTVNNLEKLKTLIPEATFQCVSQLAQAINDLNQQKFEAARQELQSKACTELADYRTYYLALATAHLGLYPEALATLPLPTTIQKKIDVDKFWLRAKILAFKSDLPQLTTEITWFNKFKKQDPLTTVKANYYLGLGQYLRGQKKAAFAFFSKVYALNAGTEFDDKILLALQTNNDSANSFMNDAAWATRAKTLSAVGQTDEALQILERLSQKNRSAYAETLAEATFESRDYAKAADLFEQLLKTTKASDKRLDILTKLSQAYARSNFFDQAIEINSTLLTQFPKSQEALEAPLKIAYLTFDAGRFDEAIQKFEPFLTDKNKSHQILAARYRAWSYYLTGRFKEAITEWEGLKARTIRPGGQADNELRRAVLYWQARASEKLGDKKTAANFYRLAAESDSNGYYGLLAKQRMTFGKLEPQTLIKPSWIAMRPETSLEATDLTEVSPSDPLYNAILLAQLGLDIYAFDEANRSMLVKTADTATLNLAHYYIKQDYPLAYVDSVNFSATAHNTDRALIWAIMRQESRFKPAIQSRALALGLMQFIPSTAHQIAAELTLPHFNTARLTEPTLNIYFGAYYLSQLKSQMNQALLPTIAAYNAGPRAVQNWLKQRSHLEGDEWVELIPYKETRAYVKRVLENYLVYSQQ